MSKVACGNVNNASIAEIWNGELYRYFRKQMAAGDWQSTCRPECPRLRGTIDDSVANPGETAFATNYALNQTEIAERALVLKSLPRIWKVTGSTLCNLDCVMCYQDRGDLRSLDEQFYQQVEPLFPYMQEVQIIGGEPFAIKRLRRFMAQFPRTQFPNATFSIVSNATIYDDKTLSIVRALRVSWMSLSIDAATSGTYARIRRGGDFAHTLKGVKTWIALGKELGFPVHLAFTIMKDNVSEVRQFAELASDLGADILYGRVFGTKGDQHLIDDEARLKALDETRAYLSQRAPEMPLASLTLVSSLN